VYLCIIISEYVGNGVCIFSDKLFPALGFGAKVPPDGHVSHELFLVSAVHTLRRDTHSFHIYSRDQ